MPLFYFAPPTQFQLRLRRDASWNLSMLRDRAPNPLLLPFLAPNSANCPPTTYQRICIIPCLYRNPLHRIFIPIHRIVAPILRSSVRPPARGRINSNPRDLVKLVEKGETGASVRFREQKKRSFSLSLSAGFVQRSGENHGK